MFVCGRPTKLALLKITHGGCGAMTKRLQKIRYTDGTVSFVSAWPPDRPDHSSAPVTNDATSNTERTPTATGQPRFEPFPAPPRLSFSSARPAGNWPPGVRA